MTMSNIIRVSITPPQQWRKNTLDQNMIKGDSLYVKLRLLNAENPADDQQSQENTRRRLITLTDNTKLIVRNIPAMVQVPYFVAATDPKNHYYSLLLQYMLYRNECELLEEHDCSGSIEHDCSGSIPSKRILPPNQRDMQLFREQDRQLENAFNQVHAFRILNKENLQPNNEPIDEIEAPEKCMADDEFSMSCRTMNADQAEVFRFVTQNIPEQIQGNNNRLRLFITGNAGTGVAACLIGDSTLHTAIKLPVQKDGKTSQMPMLMGNFLRLMWLQWKDIQFLFIDEISMVPYEMLCMIDSRLKQLKNSEEMFGGLNVLLFGDLMQLPLVRRNQVFD
ncbi:ATP-dependent DNA helicase [Trichonephila clavipes]|nr:ATP-dependent DNA helicase [Trichonephila clavipes]